MRTSQDRKTNLWCFRVTDKEMVMIRDLADKHSINVSSFLRHSIKRKHEELEGKNESQKG